MMTPARAPLLGVCIAALLAGCAVDPTFVPAMNTNPACPDLADWGAPELYGSWDLALPDVDRQGTVELSRHPEYGASLRGHLRYADGLQSIASGDLGEGAFNLDESVDGKTYYAFWTGHMVPESCGDEIRGLWQRLPQDGEPELQSRFVLRRR
ncbi:MAG: hypothetical protein WCZ18_00675 [Ottowia sp.]|nr:hypothetical protein [Ottowia sp.]